MCAYQHLWIYFYLLGNWSRGDTSGVTGEQTGVTDVLQVTEQHHHSLHSDTSSSMGVGSEFKAVDIVSKGGRVKSLGFGSLLHQLWVVDSLGSWQDLLSSHEEIVGAGEIGVIFTEHGVEGSGWDGISVQHVEVGIVFLFDWIDEEIPHYPSFLSTSVLRSSLTSHSTPFSLSNLIPSSKVILTTGYLHLKGVKGYCWLMAFS